MENIKAIIAAFFMLSLTLVQAQTVQDTDRNLVHTSTFDISGVKKTATVRYFDDFGRLEQTQFLDIQTSKIWGNQLLFDFLGRPALTTFSAPIQGASNFQFRSNFILDSSGSSYVASDFDSGSNIFNPPAVDQSSDVGRYYSNLNTDNEYQDITSYPFARTVYSNLNAGSTQVVLGGNKVDGEWPQNYSFSMQASQELSQSIAFGESQYNLFEIIKTVNRDVHGVENVIFFDSDGRALASARSGGATVRSMAINIGDQGYVDIHVPSGSDMGFTITNNGNSVTTYDLISESTVTATNSLPNGFYRVSVDDLANYDPISNGVIVNYHENYYDYSLNEYNEAGYLTASYQPLGTTKTTKPKTTYTYNSLGQLAYKNNPDEGEAWFKFRADGQIRFSQNIAQKEYSSTPPGEQYSYTNYDTQGRPVESGIAQIVLQQGDNTDYDWFSELDPDVEQFTVQDTYEETYTRYDDLDANDLAALPSNYSDPTFLEGNPAKTWNDQGSTTYYSYDIYGRLKWVVFHNLDLGYKTMDYEYDLVTGNVTKAVYQKDDISERFIHQYSYSTLDQLVKVETSVDDVNFEVQAEYFYYETGELKRTELAGGVQGLDFVYSLNGGLKGINHPSLEAAKDPGGDTNDLFGMQIDYHQADYQRPNTQMSSPAYGTDQLNGSIKGIRWASQLYKTAGKEDVYTYSYDRNNWLTTADFGAYTPGSGGSYPSNIPDNNIYPGGTDTELIASQSITLTDGFHAQSGSIFVARIDASGIFEDLGGDYDVTNITYDANGNIQSLVRKKQTESGNNAMDDLTYNYNSNPQDGPNQLRSVDDADGDVNGADDIEDQNSNNYTYDKLGRLVNNNKEGIEYIYNTAGLVTEVIKNNVTLVRFGYNERNQRSWKKSYSTQGKFAIHRLLRH